MPRQHNLSGDPMRRGTTSAASNVMRRVRRVVSRAGFSLRNFQQVYGYESDKGPEWIAETCRDAALQVSIWSPSGEQDINEARRTCDQVLALPYCGTLLQYFGITWRGPWPQKPVLAQYHPVASE